ncbi:hypothetical protein HWV62_18968 [Athelia sp. TMB]|nr:hypothetical protein HWV62_18968 [Athelia sp. TMB]
MHDLDDFGIFEEESDVDAHLLHDVNEDSEDLDYSAADAADCGESDAEGIDSQDILEDDEQSDDPRAAATSGVESLVLSFLTQLNLSLRAVSGRDESEDLPEPFKRSKVPRIELQLADRKKIMADGCEIPSGPAQSLISTQIYGDPEFTSFTAQLFRVLDLTHEALVDDIPATKRKNWWLIVLRDVYYKDVPLFQKQGVVDRVRGLSENLYEHFFDSYMQLIDDLAATFELERSDLNVVSFSSLFLCQASREEQRASSKGLVCGGGLVMRLKCGDVTYANESGGALIPVGEDIAELQVDEDLAWVLVVEKEAVFQTLCRLNLATHTSLPGPGIIITLWGFVQGKGYPDVATRQLVNTLSDKLPSE